MVSGRRRPTCGVELRVGPMDLQTWAPHMDNLHIDMTGDHSDDDLYTKSTDTGPYTKIRKEFMKEVLRSLSLHII